MININLMDKGVICLFQIGLEAAKDIGSKEIVGLHEAISFAIE